MSALPPSRMPGVYTLEVPTLPPSIASVPSAMPCFIGYTETALKEGKDVTLKAVRVRNMRDYETWFGTSPNQNIQIDVNETTDKATTNPKTLQVDVSVVSIGEFKFRMHYAMQLYYANGGGPCYIISVGLQSGDTVNANDLTKGVDAAKLAKDVTILAFPDASKVLNADEYNALATAALKHCLKMGNRVTLLDVNDTLTDNQKVRDYFRSKTPSVIDEKKYGIAYFPFLSTTLDYKTTGDSVKIRFHKQDGVMVSDASIKTTFDDLGTATDALKKAQFNKDVLDSIKNTIHQLITDTPTITVLALEAAVKPILLTKFGLSTLPTPSPADAFALGSAALIEGAIDAQITSAAGDITTKTTAVSTKDTAFHAALDTKGVKLGDIEYTNNGFYNKIKEAVNDYPVEMPPSAALCGVYVQTDATHGVWQAPANVSLANVIMPTVEIDDDFHADLNSDATSGKSVNAIRAYEGKGILVFGARTLAGNDLEWRYVSVRRTFCFIEDSISRAMQDFVFAPNTRATWITVTSMIENFLTNIWNAGGLFGATANEAFAVAVGTPETMNDVDLLEGRMIVDIKLRVARPAEFILLRYEHKFQANAN